MRSALFRLFPIRADMFTTRVMLSGKDHEILLPLSMGLPAKPISAAIFEQNCSDCHSEGDMMPNAYQPPARNQSNAVRLPQLGRYGGSNTIGLLDGHATSLMDFLLNQKDSTGRRIIE